LESSVAQGLYVESRTDELVNERRRNGKRQRD